MRYLTVVAAPLFAASTFAIPAQASIKDLQQHDAYAVVIGISQYREEVIPRVPYAVQDAEAVAKVLEVQGGIPKSHIKLLTNSRVTLADFRNYVGDWLKMRVKPGSVVYVYYAGHGTPNPQTGEAYLVPWEGHPDFPSGLYPLKELYATLNELPAKEVVVLLDSCFSGAEGRSVLATGARPMVVTVENPLLATGKVVVMAAAMGNQISSDYDQAGHGLFTYALLKGFDGEADSDADGIVTLKEIFPYVREQVMHTAIDDLNREQTPIMLPSVDLLGHRGVMPLVKVEQSSLVLTSFEETRTRPYGTRRQTTMLVSGKDGVPMVLVPDGKFLYGMAKAPMSLPTFYIDQYEVTTAQYGKFVVATNRGEPLLWKVLDPLVDGKKPVVGVTWYDADAYCRYYDKRLPTEQEWEKAARGTDGRTYPWGEWAPDHRLANYGPDLCLLCNVYRDKVMPVGSFELGRSPYGIYDLTGNVWEWTDSNFRSSFDGSIVKIIRGGAWATPSGRLWPTNRDWYDQKHADAFLGFRCAQNVR